ncbi:alpha/beta hydrolase [Pseudoclavibacter sp. CFCC 11306]|uniref:alpha/beta hydrolase n=1 Tax=Pseudoclavibacter sp. CFCC 11306 TaxID=1564493 RepID=UPI00130117B9|nr:alpha/beta hydrolase [Pseudoclavibacter sp. CFCC 11306]KAB1657583.1 alpha/beta hydrolase [Pseudoclavibacter sp. CFCC 11306]
MSGVGRSARTRPLLAALAGLVALALSLGGCALGPVVSGSDPNSGAADDFDPTQGVPAELQQFYSQQLDWSDCGDGADCAALTLPLDWSQPQGDTVSVALARKAADGSGHHRALVMNPGGPGAPALQYATDKSYRDYFFGSALQREFDIVTFDPRGVAGKSTPVRCVDAEQMDHYLYDLPAAPRGTSAYIAESEANSKAFGAACQANTGPLLGHVDTASVARDLDVLRAAMGQPQLDYLGYSYGTRIGAAYADLFPDRVGAFVLDGAVDPSLSAEDMLVEQVGGFESAARSFLQNCVSNASCPFTGTADEAATQLAALIGGLDQHPLSAADGRQLGSDTMVTAISSALYSRSQWGTLARAITSVSQGDARGAMALADQYNSRSADGTYEDNSTEVLTAVNCIDLPADQTPEGVQRLNERIRAAGPVFGQFQANGTAMCSGWPVPPTGAPHKVSATGSAPIMVIGTTGDPATPYAWAQSLADQLDHGFLVTNVGEGHTAYNSMASACITRAVERFLVAGEQPADGLRCE